MNKEQKLKAIGAGMCLPLVGMAIYLFMHPVFLLVAFLTAIFSIMFVYGLKFIKGLSVTDVKNDVLEDVNNIKDKIEK